MGEERSEKQIRQDARMIAVNVAGHLVVEHRKKATIRKTL